MALFQPIMTPSDLPPVGTNAEHLGIDLTQEVEDPRNYQEMAKDVAAFANASGGVILVGAVEDRARRIVARYLPMERDLAKRVSDAFNHATRDLCSPRPVINPLIVHWEEKFVVAINVWPFPGQAVGVRIQRQPPAFLFPLRLIDAISKFRALL